MNNTSTSCYYNLPLICGKTTNRCGYPPSLDSKLQIDILDRKANKLLVVIGHYWKSAKGDLIPDPEMTMAVYRVTETAEALTYEDAFCKKRAYRDDLILVCPSL